MRKIYLLLLAFLCSATIGFAQFKLIDYASIGSKVIIDSVAGVPTGNKTFLVDFNSNVFSSYIKSTTIGKGSCRTYKGLQVLTYQYPSLDSTQLISNGAFDCNNYGAQRNPGHFYGVDSLKNWLKAAYPIAAASTSPGDTAKYGWWKPVACLFDKKAGDTTDLVFSNYPGVYKHVEYGFYYDMTGMSLKKDLTFEIYTFNEGNTGKKASYQLSLYQGSVKAENLLAKVDNFYTTGDAPKAVELCKALGIDYTVLSNKKFYFFLKTTGTDTPVSGDLIDPMVAFDNLNLSYGTASWISPAVSANTYFNQSGAGLYSPYDLNGTLATGSIKLKGEGRLTTLTVTDNAEGGSFQYRFMPTNGVFTNDGNGNYTVPVAYKYVPDSISPTTGNSTLPYITIPAPASGSANDDLLIKFTFTPKQSTDITERFEINNGVRFWWDVQTQSLDKHTGMEKNVATALNVYSSNGFIYIKGSNGPVTLYNILGQRLGSWNAENAASGIAVNRGMVLISTPEGKTKVMVP